MTYRLSITGRWLIVSFMVATLLVGLFALWLLLDTLSLSVGSLAESWRKAAPTWTAGQKVPAYLLVALLVAAPLLLWNLGRELAVRYHVDADGVRFRSLGLDVYQPWAQIVGLRTINERGDQPPRIDVLMIESTRPGLGRWIFHRHTLGRIPIYGYVANREALVATIQEQIKREA